MPPKQFVNKWRLSFPNVAQLHNETMMQKHIKSKADATDNIDNTAQIRSNQ